MSVETLLNKEIEEEFNELNKIEVGSDIYKTTVEGLTKLCDRKIELEKMKSEQQLKREQLDIDTQMKAKQMEDEKKDRIVKNCLTGAGIGIPAVLTVWGTLKSINFEKTGTITTIMGRGFIQKLLPKK